MASRAADESGTDRDTVVVWCVFFPLFWDADSFSSSAQEASRNYAIEIAEGDIHDR